MAELAVLLAVKKIGGALGGEAQKQISSMFANEVSLLTQLPSSMNRIKREFVVMHAFLSNMDSKEDNNALEAWLQEVRKIAHNVENVIDEFVYTLSEDRIRGICSLIHKIIRRPQNIVSWHRIASQLKEIESDLQHVTHIKERWIKIGDNNANYASITQKHPAESPQGFNEDEPVGINEKKEELIEKLQGEEQNCRIISIWGQAGIGKTTLASSVYSSEKNKFDCHAWITVPLAYKDEDLLRLMISEFFPKERIPHDFDSKSHELLKADLKDFLRERKYLIVLDDLRETQVFNVINDALVRNNHKGSRIIITTEMFELASLAEEKFQIEVKTLNLEKAKELFFKKAFYREEYTCPRELEESATKIVKKCGGLPLAIVSVASLLSLRDKTKSEWQKVNQQLGWLLQHNKNLSNVKLTMTLSFKYLPRYLQTCFLFCSNFPKNFVFKRKTLVRLWVAEGLIEERGTSTLEEVAEDYIDELVQRSMFEVVERNVCGRAKTCRMHSLVQDVLMSASKKENFGVLCENLEAIKFHPEARHLSLYHCRSNPTSSIDLPHLRSFMVFDSDISFPLLSSVLDNSRYLMVLDLQGIPTESLPKAIGNLFNLRYLNLRNSKVKKLPKSIGRLCNLQTLDIFQSEVTMLPREIAKLDKLRHLFMGKQVDPLCIKFQIYDGVITPEGTLNWTRLQTLKGIEASLDFVRHLRKLTQLRILRITKVKPTHCKALCTAITKMPSLSTLGIFATDEEEVLHFEKLDQFPQSLQSLYIQGRLAENAAESLFPALGDNLTVLYLGWSGLKQDPLPFLDPLKKLQALLLVNAYDGEQLLFTAGSFPCLKTLIIHNMEKLKQMRIHEGALEKLQTLQLLLLPELKDVPEGIEHLKSLQMISMIELHPEFDMDSSKIEHIQTFKIPKLPRLPEPDRATKRSACYQKLIKKLKKFSAKAASNADETSAIP